MESVRLGKGAKIVPDFISFESHSRHAAVVRHVCATFLSDANEHEIYSP
jgi:hypothetical protein